MSVRPRGSSRLLLAAAALGLALGVAGCETLDAINPFGEKEKKLTGTRAAVFPEGVPGVDYNAPPPQPANAGGYEAAPAPTPEASGATGTTGSTGRKPAQ